MKLDPRLAPIFKGRPLHERFLCVALCAILGTISDDGKLLDDVLKEVRGEEVDWSEIVGGKPLLHYNGKTRDQLHKEGVGAKTIDLVAKALENRGMKLVGDELPPAAPAAKGKGKAKAQEPKKDEETILDPSDELPPAGDGGEQPVLYAGKPLEFYQGLTRDEILSVEGISPATADKILALLSAEK